MEKQILINIGLILLSIIIVQLFYKRIERYGDLPNISQSAKHLQKEGNVILFYIFIALGISFPLGFVMYTGLSSIAASLLLLIGVWTGYNSNIKYTEFEHTMHVVFVASATILFFIDVSLMSLWFIPPVVIFLIWALRLALKKVECHTTIIEKKLIHLVWIFVTIKGIIIPLIKTI